MDACVTRYYSDSSVWGTSLISSNCINDDSLVHTTSSLVRNQLALMTGMPNDAAACNSSKPPSPTKRASPGAIPNRVQASSNISGSGFMQPTSHENTASSICWLSGPLGQGATSSGVALLTMPIRQPAARSCVNVPSTAGSAACSDAVRSRWHSSRGRCRSSAAWQRRSGKNRPYASSC